MPRIAFKSTSAEGKRPPAASSAIVQELPREGNYIRTLPMLQKKKLCESETDEQASAPNKQEK